VPFSLDAGRGGSDGTLLKGGIHCKGKVESLIRTYSDAGCPTWARNDLRFLDGKGAVGAISIGPDHIQHHRYFTF
jgi:hypothetical protein